MNLSTTELSSAWQTPMGQSVHTWETELVQAWLTPIFGQYALQLGHSDRLHVLCHYRASERYLIECGEASALASPAAHDDVRSLTVTDFTELPFDNDTIDLVLLPHTLDEAAEPRAVLREAVRVLRPEGRVVVLGLNHTSLWQLQARLGLLPQPHLLHNSRAVSMHRLKDWIELLNCEVMHGRFGGYRPYTNRTEWLARAAWMDKAGDRWWAFAGGLYALMAVKRALSPTLVGRIHDKRPPLAWRSAPIAPLSPKSRPAAQEINP